MALPVVYEFFVVFFKEEMPIDLDIILVGLRIISSSLLQESQTAIELILLDNGNKPFNDIEVVFQIADELVIHTLFIFELAEAFDVEQHNFLAQPLPVGGRSL